MILSLGLLFAGAVISSAQSTLYLASTAAGTGLGTSCANAQAFGGSRTAIAGSTLTLCGTFTSSITLNGSGTNTAPITLAFDCASQAKFSMPALPSSGTVILTGSYVIVDGKSCGFVTPASGPSSGQSYSQMASTSNCQSGCTNSQISMGIIANSGNSNVTIQNLSMGPFFLHNTTAPTPWGGAPYPVAFQFNYAKGNITANNNYLTDCAWCFTGQSGSVTISNNVIRNFDHGLGMGIDSTTPLVISNVYYFGNDLSGASAWDTTDNEFHHDGLHLWAYCSDNNSYCDGSYWSNVYIYGNHFHGNWGTHPTAFVYFEDNVRNAWLFNNIFDCSTSPSQCNTSVTYLPGVNVNVLNNTFFAYPGTVGGQLTLGGPNITVVNNIFATTSLYFVGIMPTDTSGNNKTSNVILRNNVYMNNQGKNGWMYQGKWYQAYSSWQAASGELAGNYYQEMTVDPTTGKLLSGSPAAGQGIDLTATCILQPNPGLGALCFDNAAQPRAFLSGVKWDPGVHKSPQSSTPGIPGTVKGSVGPK
jgi:hypothetical protein